MMNVANWPPKIAICVGAVIMREDKILFVREAKGGCSRRVGNSVGIC